MILTEAYLIGRYLLCLDAAEESLVQNSGENGHLSTQWLLLADKWYHLYENVNLEDLGDVPLVEEMVEGDDGDDEDELDEDQGDEVPVGANGHAGESAADVAEALGHEFVPGAPTFVLDDMGDDFDDDDVDEESGSSLDEGPGQ